jgi:hypothetical protein
MKNRHTSVPIKDMPEFQPYLAMVRTGLPKKSIARKMKVKGLDPEVLDMDPELPIPKQVRLRIVVLVGGGGV